MNNDNWLYDLFINEVKGALGTKVPGQGTGSEDRTETIELFSDKWVGEDYFYSQVVTVPSVTVNTQVDLTPSAEQFKVFRDKDVGFVAENMGGVVTVYLVGQKIVNDYVFQVTLSELMTHDPEEPIIGNPVGTTISPQTISDKLQVVKTINGLTPDENGNVTISTGGSVDTTEFESRVKELEKQMADLTYVAIAINSFTHNLGSREYGETVESATFYWSTNKEPTTLTFDGKALDVASTSLKLNDLSVTSTKSYKLQATDERGGTASKTVSISFYNGVYYGVSTTPSNYDSGFILGLTKELRSNKKPSFTANAGENQHIYYCLPTRMGSCKFTVGGFTGGFTLVDTISFTNASGYTEDYYIYKSDNAGLGSTSVTVV